MLSHIQTLSQFKTRHAATLSGLAAQHWLEQEILQIIGSNKHWELVRQPFPFQLKEYTSANLIVRPKQGPKAIYIFGAHYDSTNDLNYHSRAPGVDDNASGVVVMQSLLSRLISSHLHVDNIWLVFFGAEEINLNGSRALATWLADNGYTVELMVNNDLVGNGQTAVTIYAGSHLSQAWAEILTQRLSTNFPLQINLNPNLDRPGHSGDHIPFLEQGWAALRLTEERDYNPVQHTPKDIYINSSYLETILELNWTFLVELGNMFR